SLQLRRSWQVLPRGLGNADAYLTLAAIALNGFDAVANTGPLLRGRVHYSNVGDVNRGFDDLDATSVGATIGLAGLGVLGDAVYALNQHAVGFGVDLQDLALLATIAATLSLGACDD